MSSSDALMRTYIMIICKPIILIFYGLIVIEYSVHHISILGMLLTRIGGTQLTILLPFLSVLNPHNTKILMTIIEPINLIFWGIVIRNDPNIGYLFGPMLIIVGGIQLFIILQLFLWSNIVNIYCEEYIKIICQPIIFIICGLLVNDFHIHHSLLAIVGSIQLFVILLIRFLV